MTNQLWRDVFTTSEDGVQLYARDYGPVDGDLPPVLCLPGLTRNSKDFHVVAKRLAKNRRVIAVDFRGRGLSAYAHDWKTYQPDVEMKDTVGILDQLGIEKVAIIGTSRGGLVSMLMGQFFKDRLSAVVLNDIGPKLEDDGLIRIADSITERVVYNDWQTVADGLKKYSLGFSGLSEADWLDFARKLYREKDGSIEADYDFNLIKTFPTADFVRSGKIPEAWELFETFKGLPVGLIRGENSDLLSVETVDRMREIHKGLVVGTVPNRAHVPFLDEPEAIAVIDKVIG